MTSLLTIQSFKKSYETLLLFYLAADSSFCMGLVELRNNTLISDSWQVSDCVSIAGCTDSTALNYNPLASVDDSSCVYCYYGCQ